MSGMFASALTGFVWVALWHLVLTMTAILTMGAALPLALGPAALAGLVAALVFGDLLGALRHARRRVVSVADRFRRPAAETPPGGDDSRSTDL